MSSNNLKNYRNELLSFIIVSVDQLNYQCSKIFYTLKHFLTALCMKRIVRMRIRDPGCLGSASCETNGFNKRYQRLDSSPNDSKHRLKLAHFPDSQLTPAALTVF